MMREEDVVIPPFSIHFMTAQHELVQSFGKLCVYSVCTLVVAKTGRGVDEPALVWRARPLMKQLSCHHCQPLARDLVM